MGLPEYVEVVWRLEGRADFHVASSTGTPRVIMCSVSSCNIRELEKQDLPATTTNEAVQEMEQSDTATEVVQEIEQSDTTEAVQEIGQSDTTEVVQEIEQSDTTEAVQEIEQSDTTEAVQEIEQSDTTEAVQEIEQSDTTTETKVKVPPGVEDAVWQMWLQHWLAWQDVYINLSWIHKHRAVCKPDHVTWYDDYVREFPWIIKEITDEFSPNDEEMVNESQQSQETEDSGDGKNNKKKCLDTAYEKHSNKRYYFHLRHFLLTSGVEMNSELTNFFNEKMGRYCTVKSNESEGSGISCSNKNNTKSIEPSIYNNICENEYVSGKQDEQNGGMTIAELTEYNNADTQDDDCDSKVDNQMVITVSGEEVTADNTCSNNTHNNITTQDEEPQTSLQKYAVHDEMNNSAIVIDKIYDLDADTSSQFTDNNWSAGGKRLNDCATSLDTNNFSAAKPSAAIQRTKNNVRINAGVGWVINDLKERKLNEAKDQDTKVPDMLEAGCDKNIPETLTTEIKTTRISEIPQEEHSESTAVKKMKFITLAACEHFLTLLLMPTAGINQTILSPPSQFFKSQLNHKKVPSMAVSVSDPGRPTREERQELSSVRKQRENVDCEKQLYEWLGSFPSLSYSISQQITSQCNSGLKLKKVSPKKCGPSYDTFYYKLKTEMQDGLCVHDLEYLDLQNEVPRNMAKMEWHELTEGYRQIKYRQEEKPSHLPEKLHKYWAQRHRFFVKYDEGIKLDNDSWWSVTPEVIALHQASRCQSDVVVDAFCGAGGNAIQLARTCSQVIAIDIDPMKIALARHNAEIYKVSHKIQFLIGDFFQLAPSLKADTLLLSPPWGGMDYLGNQIYNVMNLDGNIRCDKLMEAGRTITSNILLYLPRNSDIMQILQLAEPGDCIDIENSFMGRKKKALTVYFGALSGLQ
ncbi:hypothetical protein Pcinc_023847 [Petrolisthes cinctipes]|uniref:Trimethylguanosine synthase n=1 Tax=Petrolisthes cinctipes TaxID=88211 RepID=A0AAE1FB12_PETCI|nr:hypothetical protein Pcinc_023847 [Petrolisthes cinctipes]